MGSVIIGTFPRQKEQTIVVRQPGPKGPTLAAKAVWGGGRSTDAR
jgi:hypothetical protein